MAIARKILYDSLLTVGAKVSVKLISGTCEKPCATSRALNRSIDPSELYFNLKAYFDPIAFLPAGQ